MLSARDIAAHRLKFVYENYGVMMKLYLYQRTIEVLPDNDLALHADRTEPALRNRGAK